MAKKPVHTFSGIIFNKLEQVSGTLKNMNVSHWYYDDRKKSD